jgi:hypothetical protein
MRIGSLVNSPGGMGTIVGSEFIGQTKNVKRWQVKLANGDTKWYEKSKVIEVKH